MTQQQEQQFGEMHEAIIRIEASFLPRLGSIEKSVYGNGKIGIKEDVALLKQSHAECYANHKRQKQWPAYVASVCAVIAVVWNFVG